ncbi:MAG TPA: hypothetical protein VFG42_24715 [Baekduia sp.]|uniref:hypothetical protein n=1 Tax=Baekduia sp. TaxID=2600305 RepID=UPI002D765AE9|nr:hypothetical protein [Baekduia sp.]HET6510020.1 hypothetical protein [Baekduia sp.]
MSSETPSLPDDHDDSADPKISDRRIYPLAAPGVFLAVLVAAAVIALPIHDARATNTKHLNAHTATLTVRDFLTNTVVDGQTYDACQYLTPAEQARVAALEGPSGTCTTVLTSSPAGIFDLRSENGIDTLALTTTVRGPRADVVAHVPGRAPVAFVLTPTTPDDVYAFQAPATAWRIASGATQLFGSPTSTAPPVPPPS